ncbi:MAG: hypothetical protein ABWZ25_18080 [Chitinophagaceae bacterium]
MNESNVYPIRPLLINGGEEEGADLRLSIIRIIESETSVDYIATSSHDGEDVGVCASVVKETQNGNMPAGDIVFRSIGKSSDNLLKTLSKLYEGMDDFFVFREVVKPRVVNLRDLIRIVTGKEPADSGSAEYKLFFQDSQGAKSAELYLNINVHELWIELREKDAGYRRIILKHLSQ